MRAIATALGLFAAFAACGGGTDPNAGVDAGGDPTQVCVDVINQYRQTLGLPAYQRWTDAQTCVDWQALSDSESGTAHAAYQMCPGGTVHERAQNECAPTKSEPPTLMIRTCLASMWNEGAASTNYTNMSSNGPRDNPNGTTPYLVFTKVACGFHSLPDGTIWAVQDFQ